MRKCRIFLTIIIMIIPYAYSANMVGQKAPKITIKHWLTENRLGPHDLEGRIYVVEFWATWCPPCVQITPRMSFLAEKFRKDEVIFLAISQDQNPDQAHKFIKQNNIKHFAAMDSGISRKFGVRFLPDVYLINHKGKIIWQGHPASYDFDYALAYAVNSAPPAMLKHIDLGPFENMRFQLSGSKGFTQAYKILKQHAGADDKDSRKAKLATGIIKAIDKKLSEKLNAIELTASENPKDIMNDLNYFTVKYLGSPAANLAKQKYLKLKNGINKKSTSDKTSTNDDTGDKS